MRKLPMLLLGAIFLSAPVLAQTTPVMNEAAIKKTHTVNDGGERSGANSFTQRQARKHIAESGFTDVSMLTKNKHGVWRGTAKKDGHIVNVGLDFQGNVTTR